MTAHLPALDTLRAVGALAVLTTHAAFWAGDYTGHGVWGTLLARLDVGVAIFFVLSGFLLSRPWLAAAAEAAPGPTAGRYLWKRALRILPVYVLTVVLALSLITANRGLGIDAWVRSLLMLDTFVGPGMPAGLTQMWSLAVEVSFYLALPLLMAAAVGRRPRLSVPRVLGVLGAMAATTVVWLLVVQPRLEGEVTGAPGQWLPAYLVWFALGIGLALVHVLHLRGSGARWVAGLVRLGAQPGACWAMAAGLLLLSATPLAGPTMFAIATGGQALTKHLLYAGIGGLLVLSVVFAPDGLFRRCATTRPAQRLGLISYGIFCLHLPVLHLVMWLTGWTLFEGRFPAIWLLTVVISVAAAELTYRLVERPAMRWRDASWPRAPRTTAATTGTSAR
jgi:peptidoglycan/LPS O-acetylase OafA/YrhL